MILISASENALITEALEKIFKEKEISLDDFDVKTFYGSDSRPMDWISEASLVPFCGDRRVVVVRNLLKSEEPPKTLEFEVPSTGLLILVADPEGGDDFKQKKQLSQLSIWSKWVKSQSGVHLEYKIDPKKTREFLKSKALQSEKKLSPKALETLVERTSGSYSEANQELQKLILYVGERIEISYQDVEAIVMPTIEWNVFKLIDAICNGHVQQVLQQIHQLKNSENSFEEHLHTKILPLLSRQFKLLWQAAVCIEQKWLITEAPKEFFLSKPNLLEEAQWSQNKTMTMARKLTLKDIEACIIEISRLDLNLKGAFGSISAQEAIEQTALKMVNLLS